MHGQIDDNAVDVQDIFLDDDGDGHGIGTVADSVCLFQDSNSQWILPNGYSHLNDDCDDSNPDRYPSNSELCTSTIDENCDGDAQSGAIDSTYYFADSDGDGFGSSDFYVLRRSATSILCRQ